MVSFSAIKPAVFSLIYNDSAIKTVPKIVPVSARETALERTARDQDLLRLESTTFGDYIVKDS